MFLKNKKKLVYAVMVQGAALRVDAMQHEAIRVNGNLPR